MTVAIATCSALPDGDEDAALLRHAFGQRGIAARWRIWDDPGVSWPEHELVVVRSTWDYTADRGAFLDWAAGIERLLNPAGVLAWNTDKTYLRELAAAGVAIVPTSWAAPGERPELPAAGEFVVKPSIGAGAKGAGRFRAGDPDALAHARSLHAAGRTVMVQPYLDGVDVTGETALVYLDGRFSHAIAKSAMLPARTVNALDPGYSRSLHVAEQITVRTPSEAELAAADLVTHVVRRKFGGDPLYARIDLLPSAQGPLLIELELTEPSLFLGFARGSADTLVAAIERRLSLPAR
jgi:glutathione synthase/RimK-type ligase-like ATP-grasp enzyme